MLQPENLGQPIAGHGRESAACPRPTAPRAFESSGTLGARDRAQPLAARQASLGSAYVSGSTHSTDFPIAGVPSQPAYAGAFDSFVTKLDSTSALVYSTYLGGQ